MDLSVFEQAVVALADFPKHSEPNKANNGTKVVGMIGGEPLLHPEFADLRRLMVQHIPSRVNRGLWTGFSESQWLNRKAIRKTFGYINQNLHTGHVIHQPILVAIQDVVADRDEMWQLIDDCWVQRMWSSTITPKGFFFCEVAAAMDMIFDGPGGLPVTPDCWKHDLLAYREQIERWCPMCGAAVPLQGRRDSDEIDDISPSNLNALMNVNSPRVAACDYDLCTHADCPQDWRPQQYKRGNGQCS
jgi:hypothetical protein